MDRNVNIKSNIQQYMLLWGRIYLTVLLGFGQIYFPALFFTFKANCIAYVTVNYSHTTYFLYGKNWAASSDFPSLFLDTYYHTVEMQ